METTKKPSDPVCAHVNGNVNLFIRRVVSRISADSSFVGASIGVVGLAVTSTFLNAPPFGGTVFWARHIEAQLKATTRRTRRPCPSERRTPTAAEWLAARPAAAAQATSPERRRTCAPGRRISSMRVSGDRRDVDECARPEHLLRQVRPPALLLGPQDLRPRHRRRHAHQEEGVDDAVLARPAAGTLDVAGSAAHILLAGLTDREQQLAGDAALFGIRLLGRRQLHDAGLLPDRREVLDPDRLDPVARSGDTLIKSKYGIEMI